MKPCIDEPISYLRLERHALHELPAPESQRIEHHLAACEVCRACFAHVERPLSLPELPVAGGKGARGIRPRVAALWGRRLPALGALGALAISLLILTLSWPAPEAPETALPPARLAIRGGELAIELVRQHGGRLAEPSRFAPGDAFKALVTCPNRESVHVELVVYQHGRAYFPLPSVRLSSCGNRRTLPGAFSLDGESEAAVCVALYDAPGDREALSGGPQALPGASVCRSVAPAR